MDINLEKQKDLPSPFRSRLTRLHCIVTPYTRLNSGKLFQRSRHANRITTGSLTAGCPRDAYPGSSTIFTRLQSHWWTGDRHVAFSFAVDRPREELLIRGKAWSFVKAEEKQEVRQQAFCATFNEENETGSTASRCLFVIVHLVPSQEVPLRIETGLLIEGTRGRSKC